MNNRAIFVDGPLDGERRMLGEGPVLPPAVFEINTEGHKTDNLETHVYNLIAHTRRNTLIYAHRGRK